MADSFQFQLQGIDPLLEKFKILKDDIKLKGGRFALRKAANLVADQLRANAKSIDDPSTAEQIAKNVTVRFGSKRFKSTGDLMFRVGILGGARSQTREALRARKRRSIAGIASLSELGEIAGAGSGNPGGDTFYWRFVEFGTEKTAARPFVRPALENSIDKATNEFISQYDKALARAIKRAKKKDAPTHF